MTCPDIYIASTYWTTPHAAEYANTAIDVGPSGTTFAEGVTRIVQVGVRNHGTDDSPVSRLELFWANPGTGFTLMEQIDTAKHIVALGGDGLGHDGPKATENFAFTPDATTISANGGRVGLLARVVNENSPIGGYPAQGYTSTPATDARSAIRNIHICARLPPSRVVPRGGDPNGMCFGFVASDPLAHGEHSRLEVRALDPARDGARLDALVADSGVSHTLPQPTARFALPEAVLLAERPDRAVLSQPSIIAKPSERESLPKLGSLGPISNSRAARLLPPATCLHDAKVHDLRLVPGELRQMILHVVPADGDVLHAVLVEHKSAHDRAIGGFIVVFVPHPQP